MKQYLLTTSILVLSLLLGLKLTTLPIQAQSSGLEEVADIITNSNPGTPDVDHSIGFKLPRASLSITPTDYIIIDLSNFDNVTGATSVVGSYSGSPVFSLDNGVIKVTGIFVLPGENITINGVTATNPMNGNYAFTVAVTEDENGLIVKNSGAGTATDHPGQVSISAEVETPQATIRITGLARPETFVSFTEGENVIGTDLTGPNGVFSKHFSALDPGDHQISVSGVDPDNRSTSIVPLDINAPVFQTTTVSNILLSPTTSIHSNEILVGEPLHATGSAYPGTQVTIFTDIPLRTYTASASANGIWTTTINDTNNYVPGDYRLYTIGQTLNGYQSLKSQTQLFSVVTTPGGSSGSPCGNISNGDLNCDNIVDLTDFSILMYYWGSSDQTADMNSDGVVDLTDFSIMMYYWGT